MNIRLPVQRLFADLGYDLQRMFRAERAQNPYLDKKHFSRSPASIPMDVGPYVVQTAFRFRSTFAKCLIHSFEPSPTTVMSSFLEPGRDSWGEVKQRLKVPVVTLDDYCREKPIGYTDVLKTDVQDFDLDVVKGARDLIGRHRFHLVLIKVIFVELYKTGPQLDEIYCLVRQMSSLVAFYRFHFKDDQA